jgi:tRNA A-37 threonylcarbamoyl transferase component Bud32
VARKLGPYEIRSELGRGAMAQVWRAYDPVLDREVAIKEPLLPKGVDSTVAAEYGARFVREGRAAAKLSHANIVTIHAADIYEGRAALVMELVEGKTLGDLLSRGPLEKKLAANLMGQLLSAVGYAHSKGIVHRDIKPDNINRDHQAKLADFGIASLASDSTLTQAGTIMGTPGYMAPEQITGERVDARADLFALGVVFYEMITGRNPFGATEGLATTTVMYRIVHQAPPELSAEALDGLPPQFRSVLQVAMAKDPDGRFSDAQHFLAALRGEEPAVAGGGGSQAVLGQRAGTILTRLSSIKSATMISPRSSGRAHEPSWLRSWVPYAVVVGLGVIVMIALLVVAKTGGGGSAAIDPAAPSWETIGTSSQGRSVDMLTVGSGTWRVLVIGGVYGDCYSKDAAVAFASYVEANPDVVPAGTQLRIIPNVNPDGRAAWTRGNANAVDLNRNLPTQNWTKYLDSRDSSAKTCTGGSSPGSEPETQIIMRCLEDGVDLVINLYNPGSKIDFDGAGSGASVAYRMSTASGLQVSEPANNAWISGSLGIYVPERYGKYVVTLGVSGNTLTNAAREALVAALYPN